MNAHNPIADLKPHKLTVNELMAFERSGAFEGLPRMELLDGVLYEMSPQTSPHIRARNRLTIRLQNRLVELASSWEAFSEATIRIGETHAPDPDVIICSAPELDGIYPASSVMLAVEVSVTSLKTDMNFKKALYASAGIPEYWVLDVDAARLHQFWSPDGEAYSQSRTISIGERLDSMTIPELSVETEGLA